MTDRMIFNVHRETKRISFSCTQLRNLVPFNPRPVTCDNGIIRGQIPKCEMQSGSCNGRQERCDIGRCISTTQVCDGVKDCADGSDERRCAIHYTTSTVSDTDESSNLTPTEANMHHITETSIPHDEPPLTLIRKDDQLIARLEVDGRYTFWCDPGRTLFPHNPGTVACRQGKVSGDIPICQVAGTETGPTEMTVDEQSDFKVMTQNATVEGASKSSVVVPTLAAVSALLLLALIGCGVGMWRMRRDKKADNPPAPNSIAHDDPRPVRIVAALAPSPSEPGYLEVFVAQVIQDTTNTTDHSDQHCLESGSQEVKRESPDHGRQVEISVHPGEPDSPYDDILNLENNTIVGEYEYIRHNGKKL